MKNLLLTYFLFISVISFTQKKEFSYIKEYYQQVYLAEEAFYKKDYQKVYKIMSELEKKCELLNQPTIGEIDIYAISAAYLGKNNKAINIAELLLSHGYEINYLKENSHFSKIIKTKKWLELENNATKIHNEYLKNINLELRNELSIMTEKDQLYRIKMHKIGVNVDSLWKLQNPIDSFNNVRLKEIILEYGYPNQGLIGSYSIDNKFIDPSIILFHITDNEFYQKHLYEQIDLGKAPPSVLGSYVDSYQRRVRDKKKWIYGIYEGVEPESIIDYKGLDKRRVAIGLAPMVLHNSIRDLKNAYWHE